MANDLPNGDSAPKTTHLSKDSVQQRILANWPQKLIALACTLVLFVLVMSDRSLTINFEQIPVSVRLPEGYVMVNGNNTQNVDIKVYGRASKLRHMTRDDLGVITLSPPAKEGNIQVTLLPSMISLPEGVRIEKFKPEFVGMNLEMVEHRKVAVSTDHAFTGVLLPGYQMGEVKIHPSEIEIYGPRSVISETSQLHIEPIDLTGKASTFTVNRWVRLGRNDIHATSSQVEVTVNVISTSRQHVVLGVPIVPINLSSRHEFVPPTVDLTLVGDDESLSRVDSSKLFVTVDASGDDARGEHTRLLDKGDFRVLNLPLGVGYDETKLPSVLLKVYQNETVHEYTSESEHP